MCIDICISLSAVKEANHSLWEKGRGALVVPLISRFEKAAYCAIPSENKTVFVGFVRNISGKYMSHHMQADISRMLTSLDGLDSEKSDCGRYNEETTCEHIRLSSFMIIFSQKKAPAAAIITNTKQ